jgi:hypothetical protein
MKLRRGEVVAVNGEGCLAYLTHANFDLGMSMQDNQVPLFDELPMDNPDAAKKERGPTIFQENLIYLMNRDKVGIADIHRATGISITTIWDWYAGNVEAPMASDNLLKLTRFFNVSTDFILWDAGDDSPFYETLEHKKDA